MSYPRKLEVDMTVSAEGEVGLGGGVGKILRRPGKSTILSRRYEARGRRQMTQKHAGAQK